MQVEVFTVADAATDSQGKLNVLGSFDTIFAKEVPVVCPLCAIAAKVRAFRDDGDKHTLTVHIKDQAGEFVGKPFSADTTFSFQPFSRFASVNFIMYIQGLKFDQFGEYTVTLEVDGRPMMALPLLIAQPPAGVGG